MTHDITFITNTQYLANDFKSKLYLGNKLNDQYFIANDQYFILNYQYFF